MFPSADAYRVEQIGVRNLKYIGYYFKQLGTDTISTKVGLAAAAALFEGLIEVSGILFWSVFSMWFIDFVLGLLHALHDPQITVKFSRILD